MELYAYDALLTTNGRAPQPGAVVQFYAESDTSYSTPLEVFAMDGRPIGTAPKADTYGYINNAGGFKLPTRSAVAKSGTLPPVPVYAVRSILAKVDTAAADAGAAKESAGAAAEAAKDAAAEAQAPADEAVDRGIQRADIPAIAASAVAAQPAVAAAAAAAVATEVGNKDLVEGADQRMQRVLDNPTYAWAITDQRRRASLLVRHDGGVEIPGLDFAETYLSGSAFAPFRDSVYAGGFTDGRRYSELVIQQDGTVPKWAAERIVARGGGGASANLPKGLVAGPGVAAWGDSITEIGGDTTSWIALLANDLRVPFYNGGWSSQPAKPIAARQGGAQALVTFSNNTIPASGPANVTLNVDPVNVPTATNNHRRGVIAGIPGVLKSDSFTGPWTFTRDTAGAAVVLREPAKFTPDDGATRRDWVQVYWVGRNDPTGVTSNLNAVRAMAAYQSAGVKRFLVLQVLPWANSTESADAVNWAYSQEWPENYVRVADWLRTDAAATAAGIVFTTDDRADIAAGLTPRSFRSDDVHLNLAGRTAVSKRVKQEFISRGWA
ncbi:hypothetical protein NNX28_17075 [Arthrobacter sp. zg-Y859]|uniref:SGNH hydrolase-type esterase domain-containing protein n=1 Tax=Arthrobacter jinronghuae TaxID=2964609 RepID=A0ABT1NV74_9MICC|nr:hypothetical protein [Arthrobacter jinronghuae]MCQ1951633.1 hypothetical protein [Arthrobacter jinronghuae]UWX79653.1 hypothetical protein N2K98_05505 [Arthrobacter jinronghuae]